VRVDLIDPSGRRLATRALGIRPAGPQGASLGAATIAALRPGLYFVRLTAEGFEATGRLVRVR
jgi:hypothetical protein